MRSPTAICAWWSTRDTADCALDPVQAVAWATTALDDVCRGVWNDRAGPEPSMPPVRRGSR